MSMAKRDYAEGLRILGREGGKRSVKEELPYVFYAPEIVYKSENSIPNVLDYTTTEMFL